MGSLDRIDHTVIGDAVNLGARLCSIAGKNTILISQYSYSSVKEDFPDLRCKSIHVKGKEAAIKVYIVPTTEKNS
jgi:adenylate cyclase